MPINKFLEKLSLSPESVSFEDTMVAIEQSYQFTETGFSNGEVINAAGENNGSCKILSFGRLNQLTEAQTLHCFGDFYRQDVLGNPDGDDHQNIRTFIKQGWQAVRFDGEALVSK